jgi:hypothetical protein
VHRNSFDAPSLLTSAVHGSSFSCVVFGSGLLVKVWFVFIVLALEVTLWITSMLLVFSSIIYAKAAKCLQGYTRRKSSRTFSFNQCHKTVHRNSFDAPLRLILAFRTLSFSFVVYGLDLLVKVCFVFIVLVLEVPGLLR